MIHIFVQDIEGEIARPATTTREINRISTPNKYQVPSYVRIQEKRGGWSLIRELVNLGMILAIIGFFCVCVILLGILLWGIGIVAPQTMAHSTQLFIATPWLIELFEFRGVWFLVWYIFIVSCIMASFIWLFWMDGRKAVKRLAGFIRQFKKLPSSSKNAVIIIPQLYFMDLFINFSFILILLVLNIETPLPTFLEEAELWEKLYAFANAAVYEELITRLLLIGIPLLIMDTFRRKRRIKGIHYILGGKFSLNFSSITLILISSLVFAFAHYFSWGLYKVLPTFIGGIIFGYLFIKKGLYACIVLHFFVDYLGLAMEITDNGAGLGFVIIVFTLFWILMGIFCFIYYLKSLVNQISRSNVGRK